MTDNDPPARCPVRGCPIRYRGGPSRLCPEHQADDSTMAATLSQHRSPWADGPARGQPDEPHGQASPGGDAP